MRRRIAGLLLAVATAVTIIGFAMAPFFSPAWIGIAQARANVSETAGLPWDEVSRVSDALVSDLFLGPGAFDVQIDGGALLDSTERRHMLDVRLLVRVATLVWLVTVLALAAVLITRRRAAWMWRAVSRGATVLATLGAGIAGVAAFSFEQVWLLFHSLFFPQGNFLFDPATQHLVRLFPTGFWIESVVGVVVLGFALSIAVALVAREGADRVERT